MGIGPPRMGLSPLLVGGWTRLDPDRAPVSSPSIDRSHDAVADSETLTRLVQRGEVQPETVAQAVEAYYLDGGQAIPPAKPVEIDVYQANCLACHGPEAERIPPLGDLSDNDALERLRTAQPAGPHALLKSADSASLQFYLTQIRARQTATP
jgi:cytochrome c5